MAPLVGVLKFLDRNVRVDGSRVELGVSKHRLDEPDIAAILQEMGGEGVAEQMATAGLADLG